MTDSQDTEPNIRAKISIKRGQRSPIKRKMREKGLMRVWVRENDSATYAYKVKTKPFQNLKTEGIVNL